MGPLGFGGVAGVTDRTAYVANDISNLCNGIRQVFPLRIDQDSFLNINDSRDLEVAVNGVYIRPYITENELPWFVDFDNMPGNNGFRVVGTNIVFYRKLAIGSQVQIIKRNASPATIIKRYPFSAVTIGLGD